MAVNKNFVVKNGLEVNTDLIFADASTEKVGIGSTIPAAKFDVAGGIAATDLNVTGVTTVVTLRGTTGIVTTIDAISLQTTNLTITGVTTGISVTGATNFNVTGVTSTGNLNVIDTASIRTGIITTVQSENGTFSGILTAAALGTGFGVGVRTTGAVVGYGFTILNFVGAGNTFAVDGKTVDISIAGGGGGGASVSIGSEAPSDPQSGNLWYHTEYGRTFVWFDEETLGIGDTAVWVDAAPFNQGGQFINKYGDNAYGAIGYTGGTTSQASVYYTGDPNTGIYFPAADHVGVVAGGTKSLEVNPNGLTVTGIATVGTALSLADNIKAQFGNSGDLKIFHNATNSEIKNATGTLYLESDGTWITDKEGSDKMAKFLHDGAVELYYDNGKTLETTANGVTIYDDGKNDEARLIVQGGEGNAASMYLYADDGDDNADKWRVYSTASGTFGIESYSTGSWVSGLSFDGSVNATFGGSVLVGSAVTLNNTGIDMGIGAGICTAKEFYGDGSNLTGIAAGGSGEFNTSISGATQYDVTNSMATAYTANASASHRTIVHSIHICNISASEATISGEIQASFSFAHTIPVPAGSAVELLKQPKVLGPSETIELQASANSALEATIIVEYKEDTDFWDAQVDLTSDATMTDIYTSTTNPSVVQSILLANDDGNNDVKARVAWTDGSNNIQSYLCYDMIIPADATVELCEKPKYLPADYKLRGYANVADRLEITASGKQITS